MKVTHAQRMSINDLFTKALRHEFLTLDEGLFLFNNASLTELMFIAHQMRQSIVPGNRVTWQIDRNINITNVCISGCKFCNFHCKPGDGSAFITSTYEYVVKIKEMLRYGGDQILLQGGLHPKLGLAFYIDLFQQLKERFPQLKLHALSPPEIAHIARLEKTTYREVLEQLVEAGLNSLPGGGAEILVDRVRKLISPGKPNSQAWLDVMAEAHNMGLLTTATMMFGHVETLAERMEHLVKIRDLQERKPKASVGFSAFICWPFQDKDTEMSRMGVKSTVTPDEYVRMVALSRIMLPNIRHIQASWLTVGMDIAQICLHAGADDLGSIMIEENVVSSAGAKHKVSAYDMQRAIADAGFEAQLRNQAYQHIEQDLNDFFHY